MKHSSFTFLLMLFAYSCFAQVVVDSRSKFVTFSDTGLVVMKGSYCMKSRVAKLSYNSATKDYIFYGLDGAAIDSDNLTNVVFNGQRIIAAKEAIINSILLSQLGDKQFAAGGGGGGFVTVTNFPASQTIDGTVGISNDSTTLSRRGMIVTNFPATQTISGTIGISNDSTTLSRRGVIVTNEISGDVSVNNFPATQAISGTVAATQSGTWDVNNISGSITLPIGAATDALQSTGNTSLANIDSKLPAALGQHNNAGSLAVTLSTENLNDLHMVGQATQTAIVNNILTDPSGSVATDVSGYSMACIQINSTGTGGTFIFEGSNDNTTFVTIPVTNQLLTTGVSIVAAITATNSTIAYIFPVTFRYVRVRIITTITGGSIRAIARFTRQTFSPNVTRVANNTAASLVTSSTISSGTITTLQNGQTAHSSASTGSPVRVGGRVFTNLETTLAHADATDWFMSTSGQGIIKPFATPELDWYYFPPSGGLLNTTSPVSIKSAAGANIRNYITGISIQAEPLTNATEFAIRLTGAGTVLWMILIPTTGLPLTNINFPTPLRSTANNALEIVTFTASGAGAVYFNCQGYQSF